MALVSSRLLVAFDAGSVSGAVVPSRFLSPRVRTLARVPLPPGAVVPAPFDDNVVDPAEVQPALAALRARLGADPRACLILPDGVARTLLLDVRVATDPVEFARFRLGPALPYPAAEAVIDVLPVGRSRVLAAAVRRAVVRGYEAVAAAAGFAQERVDLAPLAALAGLLRDGARTPSVDVILGDAAVSLAAFDGRGGLALFRSRRRDPGPAEAERLRDEVDRTAVLAGIGEAHRVRVVGTGAPALIRALSFGGRPAQAGWESTNNGLPQGAAELAWFGAALA